MGERACAVESEDGPRVGEGDEEAYILRDK